MALPQLMLRGIDSQGNLSTYFPDFYNLTISPVFSAPGSVTFEYPEGGVNYNLLTDHMIIGITLDGQELQELRSEVESVSGDDANEAADGNVWTYTAHTMMGKLAQTVVYPPLWPTSATPDKYTFVGKNAGYIFNVLFDDATSRGSLAWMIRDWGSTHASNGDLWVNTTDIEFNVGTKYTDVIQSLVDAGLCEVRMLGYKFQMYNPDTLGEDLTLGDSPVVFRKGRDLTESDRKITTRDITTVALLGGEGQIYAESRGTLDGGIESELIWGRRETFISLENVTTKAALGSFGRAIVDAGCKATEEITHNLVFDTEDNPQPVKHFNNGDWVFTDVGRGLERNRVKQWTMTVDESNSTGGTVSGSVTVNDLIDEQLTKVNRRLISIENGSSSAGTSEVKDDGKNPAQVTGVSITSDYYVDFGQSRAIINLGWNPVTTNADASPASNITGYSVRWRYASDGSNLWRSTTRVDNTVQTYSFDNITPGVGVVAQVAAFNQYGRFGSWSANATITTAHDTVAPSKPSPAVVSSNVGTLRVFWDGLDFNGQQMVPDFIGVQVHIGTNGTFTPDSSTLKDFLPGSAAQSTTITSGLSYGTDYFARLVAVDNSGNASAPSDQTTTSHAILNQVVSTEIGSGQVGLANTTFSDVGNLVEDGSFELPTKRALRQTQITGTHFAFDNTTSSNGGWSLRHDSWAGGASNESLVLQGSLPVKPGERVFGAADYRCTTDIPSGGSQSMVVLALFFKNAAGQVIDGSGTVNNVYFTLATNWNGPVDNTWHQRLNTSSYVAPANASSFDVTLLTYNRTAGTIWIDAVEVRKQIDTLLIGDAAITTAKIANLAVNDAKIANLSVGKLSAGTLTADIVVGSRIKTSNSGARAEMNSGGIGLWDSSNNQTVSMAAADGSVNIIGTLRSGSNGRRIEVNPFGTGLPEIRFFPTTGSNYSFLNAVASPDGTKSYIGLNSGQMTMNSQTCEWRVYMTDTALAMGSVTTSVQDALGATLSMYSSGIDLSWIDSSGNDRGFAALHSDGAQFGYNDQSTTANDSYWWMSNNGQMGAYGRFLNYVIASPNTALFTGTLTFTGAAAISGSYGVTMLSTPLPIITFYDSGPVRAWQLVGKNTTGFTMGMASSSDGAMNFWCFRV